MRPPALRLKAAICGLRGRVEEGRKCVERLLALQSGELRSRRYHPFTAKLNAIARRRGLTQGLAQLRASGPRACTTKQPDAPALTLALQSVRRWPIGNGGANRRKRANVLEAESAKSVFQALLASRDRPPFRVTFSAVAASPHRSSGG